MFGGAGVYRNGLMFALVADGQIYLKADAETKPRFAAARCRPFLYNKGAKIVETSYWTAPEESLDDPAALKLWADLAFAAALRASHARAAPRRPRRRS